MRRVFAAIVQFVLFLLTFALGSFVLHPFHAEVALASDAAHRRVFVADGLLLMLLLYFLVLVSEVLMKRIRSAAVGSTLAVLLAGALGLLMKFGFLMTDR